MIERKELTNILRAQHGDDVDFQDAWITYCDLHEEDDPVALEKLSMMPEWDRDERLRWRMLLAEEGMELTPDQVDQYISIVQLRLEQ
ncbi:MAG: hypothetical protein CMH30_00870 [Micavibrio sp.]|nr:hypothetical protein [Micavibrio sp.]